MPNKKDLELLEALELCISPSIIRDQDENVFNMLEMRGIAAGNPMYGHEITVADLQTGEPILLPFVHVMLHER